MKYKSKFKYKENKMSTTRMGIICGIALVVLFAALFTISGMTKIDSGNRGVEVVFGKVSEQTYSEGLYFFNPISTKIIEFNTKENIAEVTESAFSSDVQQATITVKALVYPDRNIINELYQNYGQDFMQKLVEPVLVGQIKEVAGKFSAVDMVTKRDALQQAILKSVSEELAKRSITVTRLDITDLQLREEFKQAVEAKVIAQQEAERAKNITVKIEEEAKQKVIAAKAEAESIRIRANALAQNKSLVQYELAIRWDGRTPLVVGSSMPLIDLNNITGNISNGK